MSITADVAAEKSYSDTGKWIHVVYPNPQAEECLAKKHGVVFHEAAERSIMPLVESITDTSCFPCISLLQTLVSLDPRLRPATILVIKPSTDKYTSRFTEAFPHIASSLTGYSVEEVEIDVFIESPETLWNLTAGLYRILAKTTKRRGAFTPRVAVNLESFPPHTKPSSVIASLLAGVRMLYYNVNGLPFIHPIPPVEVDHTLLEAIAEAIIPGEELDALLESRLLVSTPLDEKPRPNPLLEALLSGEED